MLPGLTSTWMVGREGRLSVGLCGTEVFSLKASLHRGQALSTLLTLW